MEEDTGILPGLPAVAGKPVRIAFDGGRLTSDAGILLLAAVEQRLKIAKRLAACLEDPRDPDRVRHELAEMIRYRALLIAAGYPDGNDCDALKADPAFKMAVGRLPESGEDLCSQPTISRLENLPGAIALKRMMGSLHESALSVRHLGRSMNGLRAGMSAPPLMAAAWVAARATSLTCQEPTFTGPLPNRRSRPILDPKRSLVAGSGDGGNAPQRPFTATVANGDVGWKGIPDLPGCDADAVKTDLAHRPPKS